MENFLLFLGSKIVSKMIRKPPGPRFVSITVHTPLGSGLAHQKV